MTGQIWPVSDHSGRNKPFPQLFEQSLRHLSSTRIARAPVLLEDIDDPEEFTRRYNEAAGPCVAAILQDRDLTQEDAATVLGVSTRQFRRLVNGEVSFTVPQLQLLARKTKTTVAAILDFIEEWPSKTDAQSKGSRGR